MRYTRVGGHHGMGTRRSGLGARGFGVIEILLVLVVVALAGALLLRYVGSTAKTPEKPQEDPPLHASTLGAHHATLASVHGLLRNYAGSRLAAPIAATTMEPFAIARPSTSTSAFVIRAVRCTGLSYRSSSSTALWISAGSSLSRARSPG